MTLTSDFGDGVRGERKRDTSEEQAVVAYSVGQVIGGAHASAADRDAAARRDVTGGHRCLLASCVSEYAGYESEYLEGALVGDRQFVDGFLVDAVLHRGVRLLDQRGFTGDVDFHLGVDDSEL